MNINHKKKVDTNEVHSLPFKHFLVNGISFAFNLHLKYNLRQKYCTLYHGNLSFSKMDRAVHLAMNTSQVSQKMKSSLYKNLGFEVNSEYIFINAIFVRDQKKMLLWVFNKGGRVTFQSKITQRCNTFISQRQNVVSARSFLPYVHMNIHVRQLFGTRVVFDFTHCVFLQIIFENHHFKSSVGKRRQYILNHHNERL